MFVTTSYLTKQAYEELRGDRHPVVVITGRDVAGVCYDSTATRRFPKYFLARDQVPAAACPLMTNRVMTATGRNYARIYERVQRKDAHEFVAAAVEAAGGRVLLSSGPSTAPLFLSIEDPAGARIGLSAYVFSANRVTTKHRPTDEHRAQVRYGNVNDRAWRLQAHPLGWDPADLDVRLLLVVHRDAGLLVALDPLAYDPLPLGNSIYFKDDDVEQQPGTAGASGSATPTAERGRGRSSLGSRLSSRSRPTVCWTSLLSSDKHRHCASIMRSASALPSAVRPSA